MECRFGIYARALVSNGCAKASAAPICWSKGPWTR